MKLGELPFGSNIKIPERREGGTYELADYTLGFFGAGMAAFIRKDIHSQCWFGNNAEYAGSDLDKRMTDIYNSYPDEFKKLIIPSTIPLYNGSGAEDITRKVFAPTMTMVGCGDNHRVQCWFGNNAEYAGSDLDKRMTDIYNSYPDEFKKLIIPSTIPLYNGSGAEDITRKVFAPTMTMVGCGDNHRVDEGFAWPIFTGRNNRKKTFNGSAAFWWLSSLYSSDGAWRVSAGGSADYDDPSVSLGVVPAFIILQSVQIDDTPDNDGSYRLTVLESYCS